MENKTKLDNLRKTAREIRGAALPKSITPEMVGGSIEGVVDVLGETLDYINRNEEAWKPTGKCAQETGDRADIPMSQKAVTDRLSTIHQSILDSIMVDNCSPQGEGITPEMTAKNGYYLTSGKFVNSESIVSYMIDLAEDSYYLLTNPEIGDKGLANYSILDSNGNYIAGRHGALVDVLIKPCMPLVLVLTTIINNSPSVVKYANALVNKIADEAVKSRMIGPSSIDTSHIGAGVVTPKKTTFFQSQNLFDISDDDIMLGYYQSNLPIANSSYNLTGYIAVIPGQNYIVGCNGAPIRPRFVTFFAFDNIFHSYLSFPDSIITIPDDVRYVRFSIGKSEWEHLQIQEGEILSRYSPFKEVLKDDCLPPLTFDKFPFTYTESLGKNILSPNEIIAEESKYVRSDTGEISTLAGYAWGYTGYIPIDRRGLVITGGNIAGTIIGHAVYDSNKVFIRGVRTPYVKWQDGDAFVRFSISNTEEIMVERGVEATTYEPYLGQRQVISPDCLPSSVTSQANIENEIKVSLPSKIYAIEGDTLQLFFRGMIQAVDPYRYNIVVACSKGNQYPRYWEYTPKPSDVGETPLKIIVKDDNRNIVASETCTLITRKAGTSPKSKLNVLCFGDSLTSGGVWCAEANRRLTETDGLPIGVGLSNISFKGSKTNGNTGYFGVGGWTWRHYTTEGLPAFRFEVSGVTSLSIGSEYKAGDIILKIMEINLTDGSGNILCSVDSLTPAPASEGVLTKVSGSGDSTVSYTSAVADSRNPLWDKNTKEMTFIPYANAVADGQIDVVYTLLTWNGLLEAMTDFTNMISQVTVFADTLHKEFPNAKLKILGIPVPSVRGGMGMSYGATGKSYADVYGMVVTALNMNSAYQEFANREEYKDFVEFVNVSSQFDTEYNMPHTDKPVNTRNDIKEWIDTNGVHPANAGYYQIADVVYRNLIANFC